MEINVAEQRVHAHELLDILPAEKMNEVLTEILLMIDNMTLHPIHNHYHDQS